MASIVLIKVAGGMLVPADEQSREIVEKWKLGEGVRAEVRRMRNPQHHRKFFALVSVVAQSSDVFDTEDKALVGIKIASGHVDWMPHPKTGELIPIPKSISFGKMDQDEFNLFYNNAVNAVLQHLLPAMNRVSLDRAVDMIGGF